MLTFYGKEMLGFRQMTADEAIQAVFHRADVFSIDGITLENGAALIETGIVDGKAYTVGIASEINSLATQILGDVYTDDEATWQKEDKCTPPFLLVYVGPTSAHTCKGGWTRDEPDPFWWTPSLT